MGQKRKSDDRCVSGESEDTKRLRPLDPREQAENARVDEPSSIDTSSNGRNARRERPTMDSTYGQKSAIPGLDDHLSEDEDDIEGADGSGLSTKEALAYLRTVR
jgi:hypothetical protein